MRTQAAHVEDLSLQDCVCGLIFKGWSMMIPTNVIIAVIKKNEIVQEEKDE